MLTRDCDRIFTRYVHQACFPQTIRYLAI